MYVSDKLQVCPEAWGWKEGDVINVYNYNVKEHRF